MFQLHKMIELFCFVGFSVRNVIKEKEARGNKFNLKFLTTQQKAKKKFNEKH